jgi:hypothetical protein
LEIMNTRIAEQITAAPVTLYRGEATTNSTEKYDNHSALARGYASWAGCANPAGKLQPNLQQSPVNNLSHEQFADGWLTSQQIPVKA